MRRFLPAAAAAVLLLPPAAAAHGSIRPTAGPAGAEQRFVVTIINTGGIVGVTARLPGGAEVIAAEAPRAWRASVSGGTISWEGPPIVGPDEDYAFTARLPEAEGTYEVVAREHYENGAAGLEFELPVTVTREGAGAADGGGGLWLASGLVGATLLLLVGGVALLRRRL